VGQGFSNEQRARWSFRYESEANPADQKAVFGALAVVVPEQRQCVGCELETATQPEILHAGLS